MAKGRRARRHRITVQRAVVTVGDYGTKKITGWEDVSGLVCVPADFRIVGGTENYRGQQVEAGVVGVFEIRMQPSPVLTTYQLVHLNDNDKPYGITAIRPIPGPFESADRDLAIFVKAIADVE
jgi:hypothetical protein